MRLLLKILFLSAGIIFNWHASSGQTCDSTYFAPDSLQFVTNNVITSATRNGNKLYIGGDFTMIGKATGSFIGLDTLSGKPYNQANWPKIAGKVNVVIPDGTGGWLVGGLFTMIGDSLRTNLARINSTGQVTSWNPAPNATVRCLMISGNNVFLGGDFTSLYGQPRNHAAGADFVADTVLTWNPNCNDVVNSIVMDGSKLWIAGSFTNVGGIIRNRIAAVDSIAGGALSMNLNSNGTIMSMLRIGNVLFIGGNFSNIGGVARSRLAALNMTTGTINSWVCNANGTVNCLAQYGNKLAFGGGFTAVNSITRNQIALADTAVGTLQAFNPATAFTSVTTIAVGYNTIYLSGTLPVASRIACFNLITGSPAAFATNISSYGGTTAEVNTLVFYGDHLYVGGAFTLIGGELRNRLACIDLGANSITAWNPFTTGVANSSFYNGNRLKLVYDNNRIYIGGNYGITLSGSSTIYYNLSAFDTAGLFVQSWIPSVSINSPVSLMVIGGTNIYTYSSSLRRTDLVSGALDVWNPNPGNISSISTNSSRLYVAYQTPGGFTGINDYFLFSGILASTPVSVASSNLTATIRMVRAYGDDLIFTGNFDQCNSMARNKLASMNTVTNLLTPLNSTELPGTSFSAIAPSSGRLFSAVSGAGIHSLRLFDLVQNIPLFTYWHPGFSTTYGNSNYSPEVIAPLNRDTFLAMGNFSTVSGRPYANMVRFHMNSTNIPTVTVSASATQVCVNDTITYTAISNLPVLNYQWFSNGTSVGTNSSVYSQIASPNDSISCLITTSGAACYGATTALSNVVVPIVMSSPLSPFISIVGSAVQCPGTPISFTATSNVSNPGYQWLVNGVSLGSNSAGFTYPPVNGDAISCVVTTPSGCFSSLTDTSNIILATTLNCAPEITSLSPANNLCQGGAIDISFNENNTYSNGNFFTAQLSNASGSFSNPVIIGTLTGVTGGTIHANIPINQPVGTGYKVRVVSSFPVITGADNGSNLILNARATNAQVAITSAGPLSFCQGGSVLLAVPATTGYSYQWRLNANSIPGETSPNYTAASAGTYSVSVVNSFGCERVSANKIVTVSGIPVATISPSANQSLCPGQSITFYANTGAGLNYQWLNNSIIIGGATSSTYTAGSAGTFSVKVTNSGSCSDTSDTVNVVSANCGVTITGINPASVFCQGGNLDISFAVNSTYATGNVFTAQLSNAAGAFANPVVIGSLADTGGGVITATIPLTQPAGTGYRVRIVSSAPAFTNSDNGSNLSVVARPTVAQTGISTIGSLTFCQGSNVTLSLPNTPGFSFQWRLNGNAIPGATTNSFVAAAAGTYCADVINSAGCIRTSANKVVTVLPLPVATITPGVPQYICLGQTVSFQANTGAGLSYQWRLNGGNIPGATASTYSASSAGSYSVRVSSGSCQALSADVAVSNACSASITNTGIVAVCQGALVNINFTASGMSTGNVFTLQLSDNTGSFANAQNIGSLASGNGGTISGTIPLGLPPGNGYKVRILSSAPSLVGQPGLLEVRVRGFITEQIDICAVTIDSPSGLNYIVWNKPLSGNIDSFVIYRNTATTGIFERIGARSYNAVSSWLDYDSEPAVTSQHYYITGKNSCGETAPGQIHRTMHLTINQGQAATTWNLIWNGYEGFPHGRYTIKRGTSSSSMTFLRDIDAYSYNSFTDFDAPPGIVYYQIFVTDGPACTPTARTTGSFEIASNVSSNDKNLPQANYLDMSVWPNPSSGRSELVLRSSRRGNDITVKISDVAGRLIETHIVPPDVAYSFGQNLLPGIYFIKAIDSSGVTIVKPWVKQ